jgi:hypothetical protein
MKRNLTNNNVSRAVSVIFMMLALLWLTISLPFLYAAQQEQIKQGLAVNGESPVSESEEDSTNPFGNSTEEKAAGNVSFSEEYLHDHHTTDHFFSFDPKYYRFEDEDAYHAFHGELLVPPPNAA